MEQLPRTRHPGDARSASAERSKANLREIDKLWKTSLTTAGVSSIKLRHPGDAQEAPVSREAGAGSDEMCLLPPLGGLFYWLLVVWLRASVPGDARSASAERSGANLREIGSARNAFITTTENLLSGIGVLTNI